MAASSSAKARRSVARLPFGLLDGFPAALGLSPDSACRPCRNRGFAAQRSVAAEIPASREPVVVSPIGAACAAHAAGAACNCAPIGPAIEPLVRLTPRFAEPERVGGAD